MLNIVVPMSGPNHFEGDEFQYPKPLIDIQGKPLIQYVVECLNTIKADKRFIFIVNDADCRKHYLDQVLKLAVRDAESIVIKSQAPTQGAACTTLLAVEYIDNADELLISNSDHVLDVDLNDMIHAFKTNCFDAGVACFHSIHPKWSYVRLEDGRVVEAAEKRPLSKNAIAGLYYFRHGSNFVRAAMRMIEKSSHHAVDGLYYIAPSLNELVLENKAIGAFFLETAAYHNLYSPARIREFEQLVQERVSQRCEY